MQDIIETKKRNVLISERGSDDNTKIIWFLKIIFYIVCLVLVALVMVKL